MAWIGAAIAGGVGLVGDVMSQSGQQSTNAMNAAELQQEMGWETQMSDTAMQRRVADLKAAGLNPMLAIQQGGAVTPGIGSIPMQNPNMAFGGLGAQATNAVQTAQSGQQVNAAADKAKADADLSRAQSADILAKLPYSAGSADQALKNLQAQERVLDGQAQDLTQQKWLHFDQQGKIEVETMAADQQRRFAQQLFPLQQQAQQIDVQRAALGLPRLSDDAAWQKAHPALSGWLQSGVVGAVTDAQKAASQSVHAAAALQ